MTDTILTAEPNFKPGTSDKEIEAAAVKMLRNRTRTVYFWRISILLVFLCGWEWLSRSKLIDEFFNTLPINAPWEEPALRRVS